MAELHLQPRAQHMHMHNQVPRWPSCIHTHAHAYAHVHARPGAAMAELPPSVDRAALFENEIAQHGRGLLGSIALGRAGDGSID